MKIGIYGGSFSPPHTGHMKLAQEFIRQMDLDRLIIVPTGTPPHKKIDGGADGHMRFEMCKAAFLPLSDKITVSDYEVFRTDPCYTVDTLRHFSAEGELYMLCGSDMFLSLESWRSPEEIFSLATIVCGARVADPTEKSELCVKTEEYISKFGAKCEIMVFEPVEVSSTAVRDEIRRGIRPEALTDEVYGIICKNGLYGYSGGNDNG